MKRLTQVKMDYGAQHMSPQEEKYWMHFLQGDPLIGDFIKSQLRHNPEYRKEVLNQPVCARCERFAFHHKDGVMCPTCGYWSPQKTEKVKLHIARGAFR